MHHIRTFISATIISLAVASPASAKWLLGCPTGDQYQARAVETGTAIQSTLDRRDLSGCVWIDDELNDKAPETWSDPDSGRVWLDLASLGSKNAALAEWRRLQDRYKNVLGDLVPIIYGREIRDHAFYIIRVGPFEQSVGRQMNTALQQKGWSAYTTPAPARGPFVREGREAKNKGSQDPQRKSSLPNFGSLPQDYSAPFSQIFGTSRATDSKSLSEASDSSTGPAEVYLHKSTADIKVLGDAVRITSSGDVRSEIIRDVPIGISFNNGYISILNDTEIVLDMPTAIEVELGNTSTISIGDGDIVLETRGNVAMLSGSRILSLDDRFLIAEAKEPLLDMARSSGARISISQSGGIDVGIPKGNQ